MTRGSHYIHHFMVLNILYQLLDVLLETIDGPIAPHIPPVAQFGLTFFSELIKERQFDLLWVESDSCSHNRCEMLRQIWCGERIDLHLHIFRSEGSRAIPKDLTTWKPKCANTFPTTSTFLRARRLSSRRS